MVTGIARFAHRYALWIIGIWLLAGYIANSVAPQFEQAIAAQDRPYLPSSAASSLAAQRSGSAFSQETTDNVGYLVLERRGPLTDGDQAFYNQLIAALRSDSRHVIQVVDWWSVPGIADAALSRDREVVTAIMHLSGMLGTSQAKEAITAARGIVARSHAPDGLHVLVTGPGATIADEFAVSDRQLQVTRAAMLAALLVPFLIAYRSLIVAMVPMLSVGLAAAVARLIVAVQGGSDSTAVSMFSVALGDAVVLGAGTGFTIFLIGRYHEQRRKNIASAPALAAAYRSMTPGIVGSALAVAAALGCLSFSRISMLRTTGIHCFTGVLTEMLAALTLTPALIALAYRADVLKPRRQGVPRRWRRIGVAVARRPGSILVGGSALALVLATPLLGIRIGWDEAAATRAKAESSRGYQIVNNHFGANQLLPDVVTVETDHDIRNPAGLIAVERITGAVMAIPGVRMVQSASRPNAAPPQNTSATIQGGYLSDRLDEAFDQLTSGQAVFSYVEGALGEIVTALDGIQDGLLHGTAGIGEVNSSVRKMQNAIPKLRSSVGNVSEIFDPLRSFTGHTRDCRTNPFCLAVQDVVRWIDTVVVSSVKLADAAGQLADGAGAFAGALNGIPGLNDAAGQLQQAQAAAANYRALMNNVGPPMLQVSRYLHDLAGVFQGGPNTGFSAAGKDITDPNTRPVFDNFMSPDGRATRLLVYGDRDEWTGDGAQRARVIAAAVRDATSEGTLIPTAVELAGVGPATRDLQDMVRGYETLLVAIALAVVYGIISLLLRSPVAGFVVVSVVAMSYASALGASVLIWQHLLGHNVHWSVPPIAFILVVAVGSGYNLLLALRIREELRTGPRISIIRGLTATGEVVTTAGIAFGATMLALATIGMLSVAQIGVTVGIGLVLNILVVRSFVLPAIMVLLGRWFWWPRPFIDTVPVTARLPARIG
ncbi:MmpL family membrane protein [Mycobacterium haemophilum DSM 44634]|uniref:MMPL/RND family transporter n=1 Tax=Mycobacterium haemophilum TaxID=29311 RepID=UPI00065586D9|nr:RND family transporter [Mycobacterium haemophilum]AKN17135.1 transporter [Mycobacterium haemophilum DSM 44634]MCV7340585.1 RND family transporter [Mycobacterium haemophilum DSM 44634]